MPDSAPVCMQECNSPQIGPAAPTPFSSSIQSTIDTSQQLATDGLSRPLICTTLRRWALKHIDVQRLVIYHTGIRYSVAVLINDPTVCRIAELNSLLINQLGAIFPKSKLPETYLVGPEFASEPLFRHLGTLAIMRRETVCTSPGNPA
jgi:hypothetical protein